MNRKIVTMERKGWGRVKKENVEKKGWGRRKKRLKGRDEGWLVIN